VKAQRRPKRFALAFLLVAGCGGKVIFDTSSSTSSGTGGAGGHTQKADCVLGNCNDPCTKCTGSPGNMVCFTGKCDQNAVCQPPTTMVVCGI